MGVGWGGRMGGGEEKRGREMMVFWLKEKVRYFHFRIVKVSHSCCAAPFSSADLGTGTCHQFYSKV